MLILLKLLFVVNCLVLITLVLLQHGRGGGLAGMLGGAGGSESFIGPGGASKMAKITVFFAVTYFVIAFGMSVMRAPSTQVSEAGELAAEMQAKPLSQLQQTESATAEQQAMPQPQGQQPQPPQPQPQP